MSANPNPCTRAGVRQVRIVTEILDENENTDHTCIEKRQLIFVTQRDAKILVCGGKPAKSKTIAAEHSKEGKLRT